MLIVKYRCIFRYLELNSQKTLKTQFYISFKSSLNNLKPILLKKYSCENNLIVFCSRTKLNSDLKQKVSIFLEQDLDWEYIFNACYYHKVIPLIYNALKQIKGINIDPKIIDRFSAYYQKNACKSLIYLDKLVDLAHALHQSNIIALPFKGPVLASMVYEDLALRTFGDIDLLIEDEKLEETLNILQELQYPLPVQISRAVDKPYLNFPLFHESAEYQKSYDIYDKNFNIIIELHWSLFNKSFFFPVDFEYLRQQKIKIQVSEAEIYTFCAEDLIIYLCAHASKHAWTHLQWICDIAELIRANPQLNWQKVQTQAKEWGCQRMLCLGLILVKEVLDTELPKSIEHEVTKDRQAQILAKEVCDHLFDFSGKKLNSYWFIVRCRERYQDKLQFLACLLFVPKQEDWYFLRLPQQFHILYYAIRPIRLLTQFLFVATRNVRFVSR